MLITGKDAVEFTDFILIRVQGDDFIGNVLNVMIEDYPDFLSKWVESMKLLGFMVTSGDKTGEPKFMNLEEMVLLKRSFKHHVELDEVVGPLDKNSIYKALCFEPKNAVPSTYHRLKQVIDGAQREFFLHGKEDFLRFQDKLVKCNSLKVIPFILHDFDQLLTSYKDGSMTMFAY